MFATHPLYFHTRLYKYWTLCDQPGYNAQNPQHSKRSYGRSGDNSSFRPVDINWWTDQVWVQLLKILHIKPVSIIHILFRYCTSVHNFSVLLQLLFTLISHCNLGYALCLLRFVYHFRTFRALCLCLFFECIQKPL
jgi:hypothetical protein